MLALLTFLPFVFLTAVGQDDTSTNARVSWMHLYTRYEEVYLIGQVDTLYGYNDQYQTEITCRMKDGTEIKTKAERSSVTEYYDDGSTAEYFAFPLDLKDPFSVQSVTVSFSEKFFSWNSPALEYTTDELMSDSPVLDGSIGWNHYQRYGDYDFACECEGSKIRISMPLDDFMYLPLQGKERIVSDVSFDFFSRNVPTRYTYDGQTLRIDRLGDFSQTNQAYLARVWDNENHRTDLIERSFRIKYKNITIGYTLDIYHPSVALLFQQRRMLWVYLISGGLFERIKRFFIKYFLLEGEDPWE